MSPLALASIAFICGGLGGLAGIRLGAARIIAAIADTPRRPHRCEHKWLVKVEGTTSFLGVGSGKLYVLQCEKCGDLKNHEVP